MILLVLNQLRAKLNFSEIAKVFGYKYSYKVKNINEVSKLLSKL